MSAATSEKPHAMASDASRRRARAEERDEVPRDRANAAAVFGGPAAQRARKANWGPSEEPGRRPTIRSPYDANGRAIGSRTRRGTIATRSNKVVTFRDQAVRTRTIGLRRPFLSALRARSPGEAISSEPGPLPAYSNGPSRAALPAAEPSEGT